MNPGEEVCVMHWNSPAVALTGTIQRIAERSGQALVNGKWYTLKRCETPLRARLGACLPVAEVQEERQVVSVKA